MPSDDAIVTAIVGKGGSRIERAFAERAVRDLWLPSLKRETSLEDLRFAIEYRRDFYADSSRYQSLGPALRLVRVCVSAALEEMQVRSLLLAEHRLHLTLWPNEPIPERWESVKELEPLLSTDAIAKAANALEERLREIEQRYGIEEGGQARWKVLILNQVHIAKTGDYAESSGLISQELAERGLFTMPPPGLFPY